MGVGNSTEELCPQSLPMVTLRKHLPSLGLSFCQIKQSCLLLFITADVSAICFKRAGHARRVSLYPSPETRPGPLGTDL